MSAMKTKKESGALQLVRLVWDHNREGTGHSWQRLNGSMHEAVRLAIHAGMKFDEGDFNAMYEQFRGQYWFGSGDGSAMGEHFYTLAVEMDDVSACQSFEHYAKREPYIWDGRRLAVGSVIEWGGTDAATIKSVAATVTSIQPQRIVACTYDHSGGRSKVARRFSITREAFQAARPKKAKKPKEQETAHA